jgi:hypothetical protein
VSAYQLVCFPVYGMSRVSRRKYFVMDRRPHRHYRHFVTYGEETGYRRALPGLRDALRQWPPQARRRMQPRVKRVS